MGPDQISIRAWRQSSSQPQVLLGVFQIYFFFAFFVAAFGFAAAFVVVTFLAFFFATIGISP